MVWSVIGSFLGGVFVGGLVVYWLIVFPLQDRLLRMKRLGWSGVGEVDQMIEDDPSRHVRER